MDLFVCSGINKGFVILDQQQQESQSKSFHLAEPHAPLMKIFLHLLPVHGGHSMHSAHSKAEIHRAVSLGLIQHFSS